MGDGWAAWDTPRVAVPSVPKLLARYCPRCDRMTKWTADDETALPTCECGVTVATELNLDELDNLRRHYKLSTADLDDMVGLPTPERI